MEALLRLHPGPLLLLRRTLVLLLAAHVCRSTTVQTPTSAAIPGAEGQDRCPGIQIGCTPRAACTADRQNHMVGVGQHQGSMSIVCAVVGSPQPTIAWSSDVEQALNVRTLLGLSVLTLERLRSDVHNATYTCTGANRCGAEQASVTLGVAGSPPRARAETPQIVRYVGESATFRCSIQGDPSPVRKWTNVFAEGIVDGTRFVLQGDGSLQATRLTMEDNGVYYCNGENQHGHSSASVTLTVKVIPKVTVDFGAAALLACDASGSPLPFVTWHKTDGTDAGDRTVAEGAMFAIAATRKQDAGIYRCNATSQGGWAASKVELVVLGELPTTDLEARTELDVVFGQRAVVSCGAVQGVPTPRVDWTSRVDTPAFDLGTRTRRLGNDLVFAAVQYADRGTYVCTATNTLGNRSAEITLTVYDGFVKGPSLERRDVLSASQVELDCEASSPTNDPLAYAWTWSSRHSASYASAGALPSGVSVARNGKLSIASVSLDQGGVFWCRASDGIAVPFRRPTQLRVYGNPEVLTEAPATLFVSSSGAATIPCYVAGYPTPVVEWLKGRSMPLAPPHRQVGSSLELRDITARDAGTYTCTATNRIRSTKRTAVASVTVALAGDAPRFFGDSYAAYPTIPSSFISFTVQLSFRTAEPATAQLLLANTQSARNSGKRDFVAIFLSGGRIHATLDAGHGDVQLVHPTQVRANILYSISFRKHRRRATLAASGASAVTAQLPGNLYGLNLNEPLYLGGHPDKALLKDLLPVASGLTGCIQDVSLSGSVLDLRTSVVASRKVSNCAAWCTGRCANGGVCPSARLDRGVDEARCRCRSPFHGNLCDVAVTTHRFCALQGDDCASSQCRFGDDCIEPPA